MWRLLDVSPVALCGVATLPRPALTSCCSWTPVQRRVQGRSYWLEVKAGRRSEEEGAWSPWRACPAPSECASRDSQLHRPSARIVRKGKEMSGKDRRGTHELEDRQHT